MGNKAEISLELFKYLKGIDPEISREFMWCMLCENPCEFKMTEEEVIRGK